MSFRGAFRDAAADPAARSRDFRGTARRLLKRLIPQRGLTATVILLGIGGIAIGVIGPRVLGHATDLLFYGVIRRHHIDFGAVGRTLLLALGLYLLAGLMLWVQARILNVVVQRTMVGLRADIEDKIHRLPLSYFDSRQRGELLSRVTNDIDNVQTSVSMTISQLLTSVLTVVAVLVMMLTISPLLALITVVTLPLSLWVTRAIARRSQRMFIAQWANTGRLNAHIEETYSGFTLVKTFGHRAAAQHKFHELNADVYHTSFGAQFFSGLVSPFTMFIGNLSYVAVAVVGGLQVATGQITLGGLQAFTQYVRQFNQPLTQVAGMYNTLQSGMASAERVFDLLDADEEPPESAVVLPSVNGQVRAGRVEFEHVDFRYRPGTPVIKDLSFVAEPGSTVAIVGPTGVGKTTLVNLLMRFYDVDAGRILLDGVDIATVSRQSLRSRIGMVLQDTWLFGATIAENIRYGRPDATDDEVLAAAKAAYVDRFVHALPDGYDTAVSDDGGNISAGEKQLITIARAFLARPKLLILDEATSSVDTRTEVLIQHAMSELRRDRTSFLIAHRLSTIRDADMILVMEDGRIVERGSHTELMSRRGAYYAMTQV
jgi:ATP-binding cassette subfamily B protein